MPLFPIAIVNLFFAIALLISIKNFQSFNVPSLKFLLLLDSLAITLFRCSRFPISGDSSFDFNTKHSSNLRYFYFWMFATAIPLPLCTYRRVLFSHCKRLRIPGDSPFDFYNISKFIESEDRFSSFSIANYWKSENDQAFCREMG